MSIRIFNKIRANTFFILGIGLALLAQLIATKCGLGLTFDSFLYLDGADYFRGRLDGLMVEQPVFQSKPPLFPLFLSIFPHWIFPFLFSILLIFNLYILRLLVKEIIVSDRWRAIAFLSIAMFTPFIMVHVFLWTEPVFLVLFYSAILLITKVREPISNTDLAKLILLASLMILTRHVALFVLIGLCLAMVLDNRFGWKKAVVLLAVGLLVFVVWNFGLSHGGIEGRINSLTSPVSGGTWARLKNFEYFFATASTWILPKSIDQWTRMIIFGLLLIGAVLINRKAGRGINKSKQQMLLVISLTYYLFMHVSFLIYESSAERYLVPIYPLLAILSFKLLENFALQKRKWIVYLAVIWLMYPFARTIKNSLFWKDKICHEISTSSSQFLRDNYQVNQD